MTAAFGFPPVAPAMTVGELFGPIAVLALAAVLAVMGVLVVGLLFDARDDRRQPRGTRPRIVTAGRTARPAA
jgi:4-hydroxybenzoate polyprenyltransferase